MARKKKNKEPEDYKVLIVEDCEDTRALLRYSLNRLGFANIIQAADGGEALRLLTVDKFSLIICDWNMPRLSGIEVLRTLRSRPQCKYVPFVMLTTHGTKDKVTEALEAGVSDYIVKPWNMETLGKKLEPYVKAASLCKVLKT